MRDRAYISLMSVLCGLVIAIMPATARAQDNQQTPSQNQQGQQQQQNQGPTPQGQQNEEQPTAPIPAYRSPLASAAGSDNSDQSETQPMTPDTRPLAGVQNLSLGTLTGEHNYWQPHFDIFESIVSNPQESPNQSGWGTWLSLSGGVDLHRTSGDSDLTLNYLGGGMISTDSNVGNGIVQQLGVIDRLTLRRWTLTGTEQLSYLPGAGFGFGGLGDAGFSTGGSVGLGTSFGLPGQTALTGLSQSVANAASGEADLSLTPRASLTFAGGYSLLHYSQSTLLDSTEANFRAGYNYLLTRKDTVAAIYTYTAFRFGNFNQSINEHTIQGSYARRVTGRLVFQIAAGPQIAQFRIPIPSTTGSTGSGSSVNSSNQLYWSLNANAQYQWQRTGLNVSYDHGVGAGAGVLGGSVSDIVTGSVTREMSRTFSSGVTAGYSRNHGLAVQAGAPVGQNYDYWFAGATFSHPIGRTLGLTLAYQMQYEDSSNSFCIGTTCGSNLMTQIISIGLGWHARPISF
ncbi:MAG TPA: hypothetical protein VMD78_09090 [Candidatus Baltobacteraceae bacterium]|nr:hypothetical protein [Candidatus Baltobacteraceae bacterium]